MEIKRPLKLLVYGYGNPARMDDGLGIAFAERIEEKNYPNIKTDSNYQLNAEDALQIADHDIVIFADASLTAPEPYKCNILKPSDTIKFTTHAMSGDSVLALCNELYNKSPYTFLLELKGYEWDIGETLSQHAKQNLATAVKDFCTLFESDYSINDILKICERNIYTN